MNIGNTTAAGTKIVNKNDIATKAMGKEDFLLLLVTELKNQDPFNPLDSKETVAQLAQFSTLEEMKNMTKSVNGMSKMQQSLLYAQSTGLVGKHITASQDKIKVVKKGDSPTIKFDLTDNAKVKIDIYNKDGDLIRTLDLGELKKGANTATWDGKDKDGLYVDPGEYKYDVSATLADGTVQNITGTKKGIVDSIEFNGASVFLILSNGDKVNLLDLEEVKP